jgi:hypothetical protein
MGIYIDGIDMPDDGKLIDISIYSSGKVVKTWDLNNKEIAKAVPSNQKTGEWNRDVEIPITCSVCGEDWDKYVEGQEVWYTGEIPNFCPHCGSYNGGK